MLLMHWMLVYQNSAHVLRSSYACHERSNEVVLISNYKELWAHVLDDMNLSSTFNISHSTIYILDDMNFSH
jgi:hypothetical protein